jgi:hypothetical protein
MAVRRAGPRPAAPPALSHAKADQRAPQGSLGGCYIRLLMPPCQAFLRAAPGFLRARHVDLLGVLGGIREYCHLVLEDFQESTGDKIRCLFCALPDAQFSRRERREERGVLGQDRQFPIDSGRDHDVDSVIVEDQPFRRNDLECERHLGRRLRLQTLGLLDGVVDGPHHVEGLLWQRIVLPFQDFLEPSHRLAR